MAIGRAARASTEPRSAHPADGARRRRCPAALISLILLWTGDYTPKVQWTLTVFIVAFCLGFAFALRERVVLPLQTLSNLLAALGEGDFSIRARGARGGDPLGEVMIEVNTLRRDAAPPAPRRARSDDAAAQGDGGDRRRGLHLRRGPRAAVRQPRRRAAARRRPPSSCSAARPSELGLADCLDGDAPRVDQHRLPRRRRPLGDPPQLVPPGRPSARAAGALGPEPAAARRGAPGVAAADSRHRPRDEQLAGADQVDRRQPRRRSSSATRRRPTGATTCSAASP